MATDGQVLGEASAPSQESMPSEASAPSQESVSSQEPALGSAPEPGKKEEPGHTPRRYRDFDDLIEHMAQLHPQSCALIYADEDYPDQKRTLSWRDLAERVSLRAKELAQEERRCEAVVADDSAACVIEIFAACRAGLQIVMLDSSLPTPALVKLALAGDADCVWAPAARREKLAGLLEQAAGLRGVGHAAGRGAGAPVKRRARAAEVPPDDPDSYQRRGTGDQHAGPPVLGTPTGGGPAVGDSAFPLNPAAHHLLFFTSGTTARSRAVVLSDRSLMASAYNGGYKLPLSEDDTLLCLLPLSHVFGFVCGLLWGLSCGAAVALGRGRRHLIDDLAFFQPTAVSVVPLLLRFLLKADLFNEQLRLVLVGAGDCPAEELAAVSARGIQVSFGYGLTETSSGVAISVKGDPLAMELCPDDRISIASDGEILIETPSCMMLGYYKDREATSAVLKDGMLHTGDLGFLDEEGRLHVTGRKKDVLVLPTGTKIFLPEYEQAVREVLEEADLAVALLQNKPVLVLGKLERSAGAQRDEILAKLSKMMQERPRATQLTDVIKLDRPLPRTATGKLRRWELQKEIEAWLAEKK